MRPIMQLTQCLKGVVIKHNGEIVDDTIYDIIIQLDKYPLHKDELMYRNGKWYYPLQAEQTNEMCGCVPMQVLIKTGANGDFLPSEVQNVIVKNSIIPLSEVIENE